MQLVVLSNRRETYLPETLQAIRENVAGWDDLTIVDDSGDEHFRAALAQQNPDATVIAVAPQPAGYNAAMRTVVSHMYGEYAAFWEEDFRPSRPIDLEPIARALANRPHLAQIALLRQPWFANEHAHGGVIEALEAQGARFDMVDGILEHSAFFTGNPAVWAQPVYATGWPKGDWSENRKRDELRNAGFRFGMIPGVSVNHVGQRTGFGY